MKALLLALLLLNLCLGLWIYTQDINAPKPTEPSPVNPSLPRLELLSERPAPEPKPKPAPIDVANAELNPTDPVETSESSTPAGAQPDAPETEKPAPASENPQITTAPQPPKPEPAPATVAKPSIPTYECYTLGAFKSKDAAIKALDFLKPLSKNIDWRLSRENTVSGYRVFIPKQANKIAADAIAQRLRKDGIKDFYIITKPGSENRFSISLGLFTRKDGAIKHAARIRNKGYRVKIDYRYEDRSIYWVDYQTPKGAISRNTIREATEGSDNIQKLERLCPENT